MKKNHCSAECKQQAVCRFTEGKDLVSTIAEDLGIAVCSLRDWIKQVKTRDNPFPGSGNVVLAPEEAKIRKLERENRELKEDIEILKKAAAYFAKSLR